MRSLVPDEKYYRFLDNMRSCDGVNVVIAPNVLIREFPNLRSEEAKAVCADWRSTYRERHPVKWPP